MEEQPRYQPQYLEEGMPQQIDISGTMVKGVPGWEERVERLAKPEHFEASIYVLESLSGELSESELKRLLPKLAMVSRAASWMAAGMLKGTLKYPGDDYTLDQWMAHLIGEGADQMNYQLLLFHAWESIRAGRPAPGGVEGDHSGGAESGSS